MITGYNTDTKFDGVVYHVQTEDGGVDNPVVVTLVYRGGRILASKKTSYAEIVGAPDLVNRVRLLLEKQHRLMMAAVNAGALAEGSKYEAKAAASLERDGFARHPQGEAPAAEPGTKSPAPAAKPAAPAAKPAAPAARPETPAANPAAPAANPAAPAAKPAAPAAKPAAPAARPAAPAAR